jgi:LuxR family maltose regulon positive regulatory protein
MLTMLWGALRRRGKRVVWVSLRPGWNQGEVIAAVGAGLGIEAAAVPEALSAATSEAPIHLIFDEIDVLQAAAEPVAWAIEALSEGVRIVLSGRRFPPLRLSRLRMRGLLAEFDHSDLAFGRGETQQLLGQRLRPEEVDRLSETLAGWPALTQLAAMAFDRKQGAADRAALLEGAHPILRDFLLEEVIPTLGPVELSVLRACRDLQDFTLEIAVDLAGLPHASETLRMVEALPPLILAHEQRNGWFRLNPVMAGALDAVSDEDTAGRARRHRRASELFAERGQLEKAVLHASARDHPRCAARRGAKFDLAPALPLCDAREIGAGQ